MKKFLLVTFIALIPLSFLACSGSKRLSVLNWGEYINLELVDEFKALYGVEVNITICDSNEAFYDKLTAETQSFDIVIPSDYMIEKLYNEGYLQTIDLTKLPHFDQTAFLDGVNGIMDTMFVDSEMDPYTISIPYFWGVFGLMYNDSREGLKAYIEANSWASVFGPELPGLSSPLKVGMYDVERFAYSAAMLYADEVGQITDNAALNTYSESYLALAETILGERKYNQWATDDLKKNINAGSLDVAFTYVGDFFDTYLINCEDAHATTAEQAAAANAHIGVYVPAETIAFYDGMVIPTSANNVELALKFIDFFLDPDIAYRNSGIVGYTTTLKDTYDMIYDATQGDYVRQAMVQDNPYDPSKILNYIGTPLIAFTDRQTTDIAAMISRVKTND